jgi:hypothetical protein
MAVTDKGVGRADTTNIRVDKKNQHFLRIFTDFADFSVVF